MSKKKVVGEVDDILSRLSDIHNDIHVELKEIRVAINDLNAIANRQQVILDEHIRRTEANERQLEVSQDKSEEFIKIVDNRFKPLEKHVSAWAGAGKALVVLTTIVSLATAVYKILTQL